MIDGAPARVIQQTAKPAERSARNRKPRKQDVTPRALERWAIRHLDRFGSSSANLRRVLIRRVRRIEQSQEESFPDAPAWIDDTVAELLTRGYLDDRKYAVSQVERMRARGNSGRRIEHSLREKGISPTLAREVTRSVSGAGGELLAAVTYARRRRLGPFRRDREVRAERRERDLASLGRTGFPYEIARRVIDAADEDTLNAEVIARA